MRHFIIALAVIVIFVLDSCNAAEGGSSISGLAVTCYDKLEQCTEECTTKGFTCFMTDHCNDGDHSQIACAPNVTLMVILTFITIVGIATCCCSVCFCSPCCLCAVLIKKRRDRNNRDAALLGVKATVPASTA